MGSLILSTLLRAPGSVPATDRADKTNILCTIPTIHEIRMMLDSPCEYEPNVTENRVARLGLSWASPIFSAIVRIHRVWHYLIMSKSIAQRNDSTRVEVGHWHIRNAGSWGHRIGVVPRTCV